jgi:glycerophosphoryl diester phosphodiesterase
MIYIAHRGLTDGPDKGLENNPLQIAKAVKAGYDCEVDLWVKGDELFLGHDEPTYRVDYTFLSINPLWIHAKNLEALEWLQNHHKKFNYFWHQEDDFTLTSEGYIWTYPGQPLTKKSICVMPEWNYDITEFNFQCYGVCSDFVGVMNKNI